MDDGDKKVEIMGRGAMPLEEMSRILARKMLAQKSEGSWREQAIQAQARVAQRASAVFEWADKSDLDGRAAWDRFGMEISGITWNRPGGEAEVDLYFSCRGCNGTSRILNVASAADLDGAVWRSACDILARVHPWLGELEPLTEAELKSGQYEVEGDGGKSFVEGLSALGPDGLAFAEQAERRRQVGRRLRGLEREWTAALSASVGSKAFPMPIKDVAGALAVKLEAMFMADGSFKIGADSVMKKNGRSMSGQSLGRTGEGPVPLGGASETDADLWSAFSSLLVDRVSKSWSMSDIDACVPAAEALVLSAQSSGASAKPGKFPRI